MSVGHAANEGLALIQLATRKGFISADAAVAIKHDIESGITLPGTKPVAELLVAKGHITGPQADLLLSEVAKAAAPKIIGGHQLVAKLGQGGMGAVYKAIQLSMQREVALKVLTPALAKDKDFIERFTREARAAGKVVHPNVITCFDVGIDHGVAYMSLELVRGGDAMKLANDHGGKLPEAQAVTIIRDCAKGLGAIAKAGLIHRDIKPANIFVSQDGDAKLADLGLARSVDGDDRMTQTGATIGSPAYMSPEQARGQSDLDIRTDIYSLGAALYHLLVGQPPFSGTTVFATVAKVINEPAPDPRTLNPAVSPAACAIVAKTMAKARDDRFRTAEALVVALDALLAGRASAPAAAPVRPHAHRSGPHHVARPRPHRRVRIIIAAAVAAVVVVALAAGGGDDHSVPAPTQAGAPVAATLVSVAASAPEAPAAGVPGAATTASTAAKPSSETRPLLQARETLRDKRDERDQRLADQAPGPTSPSAPAIAESAQPAARVFPAWSSAAVQALDELHTGRVDQAVATAQTLPKEQRDAFTMVRDARKKVHLLYQAAGPAIVSAKPKLSLMVKSPDLTIAGITDKGIKLSTADGSVGITASWASLSSEDHAKLRAIVVKGRYEPSVQEILVRTGLCSPEALAAADQSDPVVKTLSAVTALKAELAQAAVDAEARRKAEAELAARSVRDGNVFSRERAQKLIEHIRRTAHGDPHMISGPITRPIQLNGLVIISRDARLEGGSLVPNAGAVVVNASNCPYEPRDIKGAPFVSISDQPAHTGGVKGGGRFVNCIFAGAMLLDGERSASFDRCLFIGNEAAPSETRSPVVRADQYHGCVFHDVSFAVALPIAGSVECVFSRSVVRPCDLLPGKPVVICALDLDETLTRSLAQLPEPERRVRLQAMKGQLSPDTGDSLVALQAMLDKVWTRHGSGHR